VGLRLTKAADYAIRAMIHIACIPEESVALRKDIVRLHTIPSSFSAKILRRLAKANLLVATRGTNGGFALARPASEITLLHVVEAIEGPLRMTDCTTEPCACSYAADCAAQPVWQAIQDRIAEMLGQATLEALVSAPHRKGREAGAR
jgi:Rrf2 family transcriptional regulator, iron-sulfur cluster assembly transcription factor